MTKKAKVSAKPRRVILDEFDKTPINPGKTYAEYLKQSKQGRRI